MWSLLAKNLLIHLNIIRNETYLIYHFRFIHLFPIFSSEENHTLHIAELTEDYLYHTDKYVRILPGGHNEAPAIFKKEGVYWMITSGCTGWKPNAARLSRATSIWGPWESLPNPCVGEIGRAHV